MNVAWRAEDESPASRSDYWRYVFEESPQPKAYLGTGERWLPEQLRTNEAGAVQVIEATSRWDPTRAPGDVVRTPRHIHRTDSELYKIELPVRGSLVIEQNGRQAFLRPGDFAFVDLSLPCRWTYSTQQVVVAMFPPALLPLRPDNVADLTGIRFPGDRGTGALVSALTRQLPIRLDDCGATERTRLGTAVLDLLGVALAARLDRTETVPRDARQRALLLRIHTFIEQRLANPGLTPDVIASAHHISTRYLYKLFESQQSTVAGWIRWRRLERCRRNLLDPALRARPVSAIAARWGFTNPAHFSRVFRNAYGFAPAEFRMRGGATH